MQIHNVSILIVLEPLIAGDGVIDYTEFLTATSQLNKLLTAENMEKAFKEIDKDGSGTITVSEVGNILES